MNIILKKTEIAKDVFEFIIRTPYVAHKCEAGQFVVIHADEKAERLPFAIADFDRVAGTITLIIQNVGKSTAHLCNDFKDGDSILDLAGPLGQPAKVKNYGKVILVSSGSAVGAVYALAKKFKKLGNYIISIHGVKNKDCLIWQDKIKTVCDENILVTEDGSAGEKGLTTDVLKEILQHDKIDYVFTVGNISMMAEISKLTQKYGILTMASLNTIILDGVGMCGGCRVLIDGENKFACCDGPIFDAHLVDFDNLLLRQDTYKDVESLEYSCGGNCKCQEK